VSPRAQVSRGSIEGTVIRPDGDASQVVVPYPAPSETIETLWYGRQARGWTMPPLLEWGWLARQSLVAMGICSALIVAFPLSLVLLPVSRRRAKVRWRHIARVSLYSVFAPWTTLGLTHAAWAASILSGWPRLDEEALIAISGAGTPVLLFCWWWAALRNYLRIPHAFFVTLVMGLMCTLLVLMAVASVAAALGP